jgi:hypothetical protein
MSVCVYVFQNTETSGGVCSPELQGLPSRYLASGHIDTGFLAFPHFAAKSEMFLNPQLGSVCSSCSLPDLNLSEVKPLNLQVPT